MPNLKNSIISEILLNLNRGDFCREDFTVEFPDESYQLAKISFSAMPKYTFLIRESYSGGNKFATAIAGLQEDESKKVIQTIESPGDYRNSEVHEYHSINPAVERIVKWVENIREDLIHSRSTVRSVIDDLTEEFQASIDEKVNNPEEYFEEKEKEDLIVKLNELQKRVEALEAEMGMDPKKVEELEAAIEKSKADVDVYPKGVWYKTQGTKLMKLFKDALSSKEGREIASEFLKKLMSNMG